MQTHAALSPCILCAIDAGDGLTVASRRRYFQTAANRQDMPFSTDYVWTFHLWQEYIDYASYMLNLGYSSYDLAQHLDGQPLQVGGHKHKKWFTGVLNSTPRQPGPRLPPSASRTHPVTVGTAQPAILYIMHSLIHAQPGI